MSALRYIAVERMANEPALVLDLSHLDLPASVTISSMGQLLYLCDKLGRGADDLNHTFQSKSHA